jgi:NAD(P)-dependent dehydrogenase (short-subunit alcohol dehydrogenase family)
MGRAAAVAFAREGADVAINYFPSEEPDAQEVSRLIGEAGRKAIAIPGDLRDEGFCKDLVARAISGLGGLDILVSNAGRQQAHDSILDISTEQFDSTMKTNIYAPFWLIKAAVPSMPPGSCIIATTSEQAYDGNSAATLLSAVPECPLSWQGSTCSWLTTRAALRRARFMDQRAAPGNHSAGEVQAWLDRQNMGPVDQQA